jgi:hypothetical protein
MIIAYAAPGYFDLANRKIEEVAVVESPDKKTCQIVLRSDQRQKFKGFKLTDYPRINIYCDITFYPSHETGKYIPRPTFIKVDEDFNTKETPRQKVRIDLDDSATAENFWKVLEFLLQFKHLVDVGEFEHAYAVTKADAYFVEFESKDQADKVKALVELFKKANLSDVEIETVLRENRELSLKHFHRLLTEEDSWKEYQRKYKAELKGQGEEAVWHHFLRKHHWFLGLNIDLRFIRDLISEGDVGIANTVGRGSPSADLFGLSDYTNLIELKTPKTEIFTTTKRPSARANTWSFSPEFIDGVSQCLGQKFDWDTSHQIKDLVLNSEVLDQTRYRTVDPKSIFIIGTRRKELPLTSANVDVLTKRDTFERFRRNCRNVEIITFDELYERAYFILHNRKLDENLKEI